MDYQNASLYGLTVTALCSVAGAALLVITKHIQDILTDKKDKSRIRALIKGELMSIERHYKIVSMRISSIDVSGSYHTKKYNWDKMKYGEPYLLNRSNIGKIGFLKEDAVARFLTLSLYIRNNDIEISNIVSDMSIINEEGFFDGYVLVLSDRMKKAAEAALFLSSAI